MAFALTNKRFEQPINTGFGGSTGHFELELSATSSAQDTTVVGNKWAKVRIRCKTIGTLVAGDIVTVTLVGGTGAAVTSPEGLGQSQYTVSASGETTFDMPDILAYSENGFQSFKVDFRYSAHSGTFDVMVDVN